MKYLKYFGNLFESADRIKVYRGVAKGVKQFEASPRGAFYEYGFSVALDKKVARLYSTGGGVLTGYIADDANIKIHVNKDNELTWLFDKEYIISAKKDGYDGIKFINKDDEVEILIFNPKIIEKI